MHAYYSGLALIQKLTQCVWAKFPPFNYVAAPGVFRKAKWGIFLMSASDTRAIVRFWMFSGTIYEIPKVWGSPNICHPLEVADR